MKNSHFLLYPLLAAALLVSACARESVAPSEVQSETPPPPPPAVPAEPTLGPTDDDEEYWRLVWEQNGPLDRIYFEFDSVEMRPGGAQYSDSMARWLTEFRPDLAIMVEGHTDDRGSHEYNLKLGCRRAKAARGALIERGIAAERVGTISYGEERPSVLGDNEDAWAQNRRAVMVVMSPGAQPSLNCGER